LAYGGFSQGVDISTIPIAAVDRLEIVADGASAIYGSDAVGGVANVILKRDFDGLVVSARHGDSSDGGLDTHEYDVTGGKTWASGGLLATYKDVSMHPIYTEQRDYTRQMQDPSTLYPGSDLKSALVSGYQALGDRVEVHLDALRTEREQLQYYAYAGYFTKAASEVVSSLVSPSIDILLPADWTLTVGGVWGTDKDHLDALQRNPDTGVEYAADLCYCNKTTSYEVGAEGPLFRLRGGDARLAVGAGYRKNAFHAYDYAIGADTMDGEQSAKFAYAEIDLPLVGADQGIVGVHRLALTAALRGEKYDSFGGVTTPKLGLVYSPNADITLKGSWGRSFKAPTLFEQHTNETVYLYPAATLGGTGYPADATAMYRYGGNPNLGPERANTWSASLAFHPEALPGLETEFSVFYIDFTDRVMQAISGDGFAESLSNPLHADFVEYAPTAARQADVIASTPNFYDLTGAGYDPSRVIALVEGRYVNVARQEIRGIDLSGSYRFDLWGGGLTLRGSASLLDSTRQNGRLGDTYDLVGTLFNPPRRSGRLGAVFNRGGFSASLFGNYKGGVTNTVDGRKSASFMTFDTTLRYAIADGDAFLSGFEFAISADNIFNRAPPLYVVAMPLNIPPFDQTNYSAIGRYLNLSVSKRW
jgi:outer membrane receptor protein involved in Fe transport